MNLTEARFDNSQPSYWPIKFKHFIIAYSKCKVLFPATKTSVILLHTIEQVGLNQTSRCSQWLETQERSFRNGLIWMVLEKVEHCGATLSKLIQEYYVTDECAIRKTISNNSWQFLTETSSSNNAATFRSRGIFFRQEYSNASLGKNCQLLLLIVFRIADSHSFWSKRLVVKDLD